MGKPSRDFSSESHCCKKKGSSAKSKKALNAVNKKHHQERVIREESDIAPKSASLGEESASDGDGDNDDQSISVPLAMWVCKYSL